MITVIIGCTKKTQKEGFATILYEIEDIEIAGYASTWEELFTKAEAFKADLILLTFLPDLHDNVTRDALAALCSNNNIIVIVTNEKQSLINSFTAIGIKGFL